MKNLLYGFHFPMNAGDVAILSLDLSQRCNYQCPWCVNSSLMTNGDVNMLTLDERKHLISQAKEMGLKTLVIPGTGEPTLDPHFKETVSYANDLGLITVVYTNLTGRVDSDLIQWMFNNNVSVVVKLDSLRDYHFLNRYCVDVNTFHKFFANLDKLIEVYAGSSFTTDDVVVHRIVANMVLTKENVPEVGNIVHFCGEKVLPLFIRPVKPADWAEKNPGLWQELGNSTGELVAEHLLLDVANQYNFSSAPSNTIEGECAIYFAGITVKRDGLVQRCPSHHESKGCYDVREDTLREIATGLQDLRETDSGCLMLDK